MKLEQQVVSLELAKKLKELGFETDANFAWQYHSYDGNDPVLELLQKGIDLVTTDAVITYTASELGVILPPQLISGLKEPWLVCTKGKAKDWEVGYASVKGFTKGRGIAKTEADARAKMLIYLLENKLI